MLVTITGAKPNLQVLQEQLTTSALAQETTLLPVGGENHDQALHDSELWQLLIDLGVGLVGAGTYDAVKAAVAAARRRGRVRVQGLDELSDED